MTASEPGGARLALAFAAGAACATGAALLGVNLYFPRSRPVQPTQAEELFFSSSGAGKEEGTEEEDDVPPAFQDPISFGVMHDPVLLVGTGQAYDYPSLVAWFSTGARRCPKTNIPLLDIEVVRLPLLRQAIHDWLQRRGRPIPEIDVSTATYRLADPRLPLWVGGLRGGDVHKRGLAAAKVNDMLIQWGHSQPAVRVQEARQQVMEGIMLDLLWLMRNGTPYGQGVACAALGHYPDEGQRLFLAVVGVVPAISLLWTPNDYSQHSAARLISIFARAHPSMPQILTDAGAVRGLLYQVDLRNPFRYARCSAAAALWGIARCEAGRERIREAGGVPLLKMLVAQQEPPYLGAQREHLVRYDQRDGSGALLELDLTPEEAALPPTLSLAQLRRWKYCSHAWLYGQVQRPDEGYSDAEVRGGAHLAAAMEEEEEQQQRGLAAGADTDPQEGEEDAPGEVPPPPEQPVAAEAVDPLEEHEE